MSGLLSDGSRMEEEAREAELREESDPDYDASVDVHLSRVLVRVNGYLRLRDRSLASHDDYGFEPDRKALKEKLAESGRDLTRILKDMAERLEKGRL